MHRHNPYHRTKRQLVGTAPVPPAWRPNVIQAQQSRAASEDLTGSKIFLSRLPIDVNEQEVEDLFKKTVGPVKEAFLVFNSQGNSKGMAVVSFVRPTDAAVARAKYNGKIVDGRRPIKIEIISDEAALAMRPPAPAASAPQAAPSLMDRLGVSKPIPSAPKAHPTRQSLVQRTQTPRPHPPRTQGGPDQPLVAKLQAQAAANIAAGVPTAPSRPVIPQHRTRMKKGPKRLKKQAVSAADLDKQMDDYRSSFPNTESDMSFPMS